MVGTVYYAARSPVLTNSRLPASEPFPRPCKKGWENRVGGSDLSWGAARVDRLRLGQPGMGEHSTRIGGVEPGLGSLTRTGRRLRGARAEQNIFSSKVTLISHVCHV